MHAITHGVRLPRRAAMTTTIMTVTRTTSSSTTTTTRLLRPPCASASSPSPPPRPRRFSHKHPRLIVAAHRSAARPQLPFLHPSSQHLSHARLSRFFSISSHSKRFIKDTAWQTVYWTLIIGVCLSYLSIMSFCMLSERQERAFPSPHEWSLITRARFRRGRWWQIPENNEDEGFPNWARVYHELDQALKRLEHADQDGAGLVEQGEVALPVPGQGKAGYDLSAKSGEWRQGYFEVLMGMAAAAERMEGWVTTKSRKNVWSPEFVESPTNPRPKATLPGMPALPDKDQRIPAAAPPENFYLKIITSKGLTTHQRLAAALGYADWLAFKKLPDSAEQVYRWALDIAVAGLATPDPSQTINSKTAVLSPAPQQPITPNLVYATTNLATFHASQGNITAALPIFVSVLRARLSAEPAPPTSRPKPLDSSIMSTLYGLLDNNPYPPLPPTGDEPLRRRPEDRCEEAALKNYIGEILFVMPASAAAQRQQGLVWVRDAVSTAKMAQSLTVISSDDELRKKCEQCEEVGLEAWGKMLTYLSAEARENLENTQRGWDPQSFFARLRGTRKLEDDVDNLESEEEGVVMRLNKLRTQTLKAEYEEMDRKYARIFVF